MAYATIEQANEYIEKYYSSTDSLREAWDDLDDDDKQVYLNKAERAIDQLPFTGRPLHLNKAFPREPNAEYSLEQVKYATIELAIRQLDPEQTERMTLIQQGVKSYRLGDLSETFREGQTPTFDLFAYSIIAPFLKDWTGGGYRICPTHFRR